ncbi:unnamed protein product, partial [Brenthis ino]
MSGVQTFVLIRQINATSGIQGLHLYRIRKSQGLSFAPRPSDAMGVPRVSTAPELELRVRPHLLIVDDSRETRATGG